MKKISFKNITKEQVSHFFRYLLIILAGNAITAAGTAFFLDPNGFVMGGVTGLGIFIRSMIPETVAWRSWAVNITVYAANIILFVIGAIFLGKKFALATFAGTILYPAFMSVFKIANDAYLAYNGNVPMGATLSGDASILAIIFGAGCYGMGIALVMRIGASTGGTDIPALIANKFFGVSVAVSLWVIDFVIILLNFFTGSSVNDILWGIVVILVTSIVLEILLPVGVKKMQVKIVSKKFPEIRDMIMQKLNRGVTLLYGQTGFLKEDCSLLLTVVSKRELVKLKEETHKIDPEAFLMVSVISEVQGRGFSKRAVKLTQMTTPAQDPQVVQDSQI